MQFMGTFRPKLDDKGRLTLPAKFRDRLAEGVVVTQGLDHSLIVWPPEVFDVEAQRTAERSMYNAAARANQRTLFSGAEEAVPDKQGRISIPAELRNYAGLTKEAVVIGVHNRLEIWSSERWATYHEPAVETFANLDEPEPAG